MFQIAASNSNGKSPYAKFNLAQAGAPAVGASSVTVSTTNVSTVVVNWSYSTNANECKAQFFGISILPSTGTPPSSGATVSQWNDKSGNGYNTNQVTGTPTFNTSLGVVFNGSSNYSLPNNALPFGNSSYSIFFVATGASGAVINGGFNSDTGYPNISVRCNGSSINVTWWHSNDYNINVSTSGSFIFNTAYASGSNMTASYNGTVQTPYSPPGVTRTQANTNNFIGSLDGGSTKLTGTISEIIVYNNNLSTTNRQIVEGYLAWKWGLQGGLPTTHPYYSYPVTLIMPVPLVYLNASTYSGTGTWLDSSSNGKNATIENGVAAKNTTGNGIVLNGSTNWTFPNIAAGNTWTACVWYKNTGTAVGSSNDYGNKGACILTQYFIPGTDSVINLTIGSGGVTTANNGYYSGALFSGSWRNGTLFTLTNNVWTQIIVSWDGTNMITYINGSLFGSTTPGGTGTDNTRAYRIGRLTGPSITDGQPYVIGRRWDNPNTYLTGEIGEVRIYGATLSPAQVLNLYNTTAATYV